jgi:hypothetical protein
MTNASELVQSLLPVVEQLNRLARSHRFSRRHRPRSAGREPSGIPVGKPDGLRRSANKNTPNGFKVSGIGCRPRLQAFPVLVAPARGRDWRDYEGCTVIKANRIEAAEALGCHVGDPPAMMARGLAIRHGCLVVVTAGEIGLQRKRTGQWGTKTVTFPEYKTGRKRYKLNTPYPTRSPRIRAVDLVNSSRAIPSPFHTPRPAATATSPTMHQPAASQRTRVGHGQARLSMLRLEEFFLDRFVNSFEKPPREVTLDFDVFDDPAHGQRQLIFYHGTRYRCPRNTGKLQTFQAGELSVRRLPAPPGSARRSAGRPERWPAACR